MATVTQKPRVLLIGGTARALRTLKSLVQRTDVEFPLAIFMPGYADEQIYIPEMEAITRKAAIRSVTTDKIDADLASEVQALQLDAAIGIGVWRSMLSLEFLQATKNGFLAVHGTPLPGYRGWAGIYWQIINGESTVTMRSFRLGEGLDNGPILCDGEGNPIEDGVWIDNELHLAEILEKYDEKHIALVHKILDMLVADQLTLQTQDETYATYSCHRGPEDGEINWNESTRNVFNFIRAQSRPLAGSFTYYKGQKVILWRVRPRYEYANYIGRIIGKVVTRDTASGNVVILTADGGIEVLEAEIADSPDSSPQPVTIFSSVRDRCKSRVEAYLDRLRY